jgi:hypothetical protein
MPLENECLHQMLLNSEYKVNSFHCKYNSIIENLNRGTSFPMIKELSHTKMIRQTDNEHLDISFITIGYSFYYEMRRRMLTMECYKFPP